MPFETDFSHGNVWCVAALWADVPFETDYSQYDVEFSMFNMAQLQQARAGQYRRNATPTLATGPMCHRHGHSSPCQRTGYRNRQYVSGLDIAIYSHIVVALFFIAAMLCCSCHNSVVVVNGLCSCRHCSVL